MKRIVYIHMMNRWMTFGEELGVVYLFDMEKVRLKPEEVMEKVAISSNEMLISQVLEIVPMSIICIVAGNEVSFYG